MGHRRCDISPSQVLTTFSVVGILYIIMFMVYGFTSMRYRPTLAYVAKMRAVPLSVLILSVLDFVTRMILQIAFASGAEVGP